MHRDSDLALGDCESDAPPVWIVFRGRFLLKTWTHPIPARLQAARWPDGRVVEYRPVVEPSSSE